MKCSFNAIHKFKYICNNELNTSNEDVIFKLNRAYDLGTYITATSPECFTLGFGTLRLDVEYGVITDVYRGSTSYRVNKKLKKEYRGVL